jgi:hypothetical protein
MYMKRETCPDCGCKTGEPHKNECDIEHCSVCKGQRLTCECENHDPLRSVWTGAFPIQKNIELSLKLSKDKRIRAKPQQCYYNAFKTMFYCTEFETATYVEGIVHDVISIEHAWIEFNGEIIDPTLPQTELIYFPGLRFEGLLGLSNALQLPKPDLCEDLPFFNRFGWGGKDSPEFRAAWAASMRYCNLMIEQNAEANAC